MIEKLLWRIDMLIYRLFYWRWTPRLKSNPDLAYMFAEFSSSWSKTQPPQNRDAVDILLEAERERIQHGEVCLDKSHWSK